MSSEKAPQNREKPVVKTSGKKEEKTLPPTERDHYVYAAIIAELGY